MKKSINQLHSAIESLDNTISSLPGFTPTKKSGPIYLGYLIYNHGIKIHKKYTRQQFISDAIKNGIKGSTAAVNWLNYGGGV